MKKKEVNKNKKPVFDENIDNSINGFSLVCTFFLTGMFLQFNEDFFGIATKWVRIIFIIIGFIGLFTEINNLNDKMKIKGFDNIAIGMAILILVYTIKINVDISSWWLIFSISYTLLIFIFMFMTVYFICEGIIQLVYSIYVKSKVNDNKKKSILSSILYVLTQLGSISLMAAQIYDILN